MDELLGRLDQEGFYAKANAGDGLVLVKGKFLGVVCERIQMACKIIERWCADAGLSVNPSKTEIMLFTKRRQIKDYRPPVLYGKPLTLVEDLDLVWWPAVEKAFVSRKLAGLQRLACLAITGAISLALNVLLGLSELSL